MNSCLTRKWRPAENERDEGIFVGYELERVPPDPDLDEARAIVAEALLPAGRSVALKELTLLRLVTRDQRDLGHDELKLMMAAYADRCAEYPADIIIAACRNPPRWKFWPELGPLLDRADALIRERRQLDKALRPEAVERANQRLKAEAERRRREAEWRPPTEQEKAEVTAMVARTTATLTGGALKSGAIKRPADWHGSRRERLFRHLLSTVNAAAARCGGAAQMEAWELVAVGEKAGSLRAMAPDARQKLLELYRMAKSAGVKAAAE